MNDSLRTEVFLRYTPETVACACIYLAARKLKIVLPKTPSQWFTLLDVREEDIQDVCRRILNLYKRPKVNNHIHEITQFNLVLRQDTRKCLFSHLL